jgi:ribonuclease T2
MLRIPQCVGMRWATCVSLFVAMVLGLLADEGRAQDRQWNEPGEFDFYVLALSWSPSFCEESAERSPYGSAGDRQCGERRYSFVVHGLWPQYERGFPEFCQDPAPRLNRAIVSQMLDLMPSPRLVFHEWDAHGTCSGLSASAFFENVRKAYAVIKIPPQYVDLTEPLIVTPDEVQDAFVKSNPGMTRAGISIGCSSRRLNEVRICLSKDLQFRECGDVARHACRRNTLVMPPVRGG